MTDIDHGLALTRRDALLQLGSALAMPGVQSVPRASAVVELSAASMAIIEFCIAAGDYSTPEAVTDAAFNAMRGRG